jgi:hypothetical protein
MFLRYICMVTFVIYCTISDATRHRLDEVQQWILCTDTCLVGGSSIDVFIGFGKKHRTIVTCSKHVVCTCGSVTTYLTLMFRREPHLDKWYVPWPFSIKKNVCCYSLSWVCECLQMFYKYSFLHTFIVHTVLLRSPCFINFFPHFCVSTLAENKLPSVKQIFPMG